MVDGLFYIMFFLLKVKIIWKISHSKWECSKLIKLWAKRERFSKYDLL